MNEETLISYHKNSTVQNALWGAVTFNSTDLYGLTYSLRIDETRFGDFPPNSAKRFGLESGYVALEKAFIQALINVNSAEEVEIRITSARNFLYTTYNTILLNVLPFYLPFIFGYSLNTLLVGLLNEKHKKLKEMMKMAGLSEWIYVLSWFTTQLIMLSIAAMVFTCVGFIAEIFSHSNFFIIYMAFILYGINLLATGFALSTLFENPRMGGAVAGIVQMFCVCGYAVLHFVVFPMEGLEQIKEALHLIPIVTLGEFAYRLGESESKQLGVGWEEGKTLGWLLLDAVIMFLLYSWMVHVIPGNTGTTRGPLFFLDKNFWFPKYVSRDSHESILEGTPMEVASLLGNEDGEAEITIKELVKIFNEDKYCATIKNKLGYAEIGGDKDDPDAPVYAVNGLSLRIKQGEIFALLGKNGAGKTTTIGILTGLTEPTSGSVSIFGHDITTDVDVIRKVIGICPQEDVLWDELSVEEHITVFGILKGLSEEELESQKKYYLESVGLSEDLTKLSRDLSGGMKRKLCVCIAFLGSPMLVFLDECTAGMDPYSRSLIWKLLQEEKKKTTIVMTTHFMEEADRLGDKIAIMARGSLRCAGTSLELKTQFGVGYKLTLVKTKKNMQKEIDKFMREYWKRVSRDTYAEISKFHEGKVEVSYQIPHQASQYFPDFFKKLEKESASIGITSFGFHTTTLEEVFLKISAQDDLEEKKEKEKIAQLIL
eukprot:TRINITY_DN5641_c0_g1_i1.p1 TRINITY_DN5641_c0_g1~~TRINITY_DN5641_c0_g1_i1.p1  ORF type:complete len:830 (-),score=173.97 TRINITY_DN5641_c0_g1_i1:83-2218(-)